MNETINNNFKLTDYDVAQFNKNGFVVLRSFLSTALISHIKDSITEHLRLLDENQTGFKRVGYDIFEQDQAIKSLLADDRFSGTLTTLANRSLFYTQGLGFQIEKEKHTGFPWHIGTQSFGYQRGEDFGCSMWVPLAKIDTERQGGGMSYVPEHIISGKFMYTDIDPAIDQMMRELAEMDRDSLDLEDYIELRHSILNSPALSALLEYYKHTDSFNLGDVLLFNKNVIHVSEPLLEGEIATRTAFVMRFVDIDSRYDETRARGLDFPMTYFGHPPSSDFHAKVSEKDGELIRESKLFGDNGGRILTKP
ncbi:phytanoyl-CoA dioxygenase family protein [Serratia inhibens]|uniref:Phytanoyl-CoA dioxygenase n=1 Tax=Serratia inhibens TaxID=2338073 RepID=A0AA92X1S7_9GAMM|nr:hypothetical protein [Serratia inhibens]ANS44776.1 hypothetical protein Q5A_021795 [Serratia inhibens PRI-2C]RJF54064.1 hypothetical protein D4100_18995 [Serratia inhibens]